MICVKRSVLALMFTICLYNLKRFSYKSCFKGSWGLETKIKNPGSMEVPQVDAEY